MVSECVFVLILLAEGRDRRPLVDDGLRAKTGRSKRTHQPGRRGIVAVLRRAVGVTPAETARTSLEYHRRPRTERHRRAILDRVVGRLRHKRCRWRRGGTSPSLLCDPENIGTCNPKICTGEGRGEDGGALRPRGRDGEVQSTTTEPTSKVESAATWWTAVMVKNVYRGSRKKAGSLIEICFWTVMGRRRRGFFVPS